ncbi:MAG: DUF3164 family protein [Rhizobiaceae bacterium]
MTLQDHARDNDVQVAYESPIIEMNGNKYMENTKSGLDPIEHIPAQRVLEDDLVRKMIGFSIDLNARIKRFQDHCFDDIAAFEAILAEQYQSTVGGKKGNITLLSYDGCMKVQVQVADKIEFGPELQVAKSLIDECLNDWVKDGRSEVRAVITRAFNTEKEGQVNRADVFMLLRFEFEDERWKKAMEAIKDAVRIVGSKRYTRFYKRDSPTGDWKAITIDLAKAGV